MSALWAPLHPDADTKQAGRDSKQAGKNTRAGTEDRPLRPLPSLQGRVARIPFITVLIAIFGVGMVGLLVVNTALQNQAFESRSLNRQAAQLVYQEAELQSQLNRVRSPEQIAAKASALGMRANPKPAFLVVPSGKVVGEQHRVTGKEMKGLIVKTPAQLAAEKAAKAAKARAKVEAAARKKSEEAATKKAEAAAKAAEAQRKAAAEAAAQQQAATEAAAAKKAAAEAAAKKKAAAAAKKKSQQSGGN